MKKKEQKALFRLSVLGSLISWNKLERGEPKKLIRQAASQDYDIRSLSVKGILQYINCRLICSFLLVINQ